ncbi:hypothetical protein [Nonomuraea sp. NEAU-A123]|uniref:hypothetical protein n=1 Tax=Nonomuraea sp. NEAU-A123 TaxID=2839649 RepID=UPI001BE3E46F|nr:hypothetical protein [Nonomuraea sp. NEAU-A123]MBT2226293.1 hypothetical protein [Nonomuraea sp. NEAU-A123]
MSTAFVFTVRYTDADLDDTVFVAARYETDPAANFVRFLSEDGREIRAFVFHLVREIETSGYAATVAEAGRPGLTPVPSGVDVAVAQAADQGAMRPAPVPPSRQPIEGAAAAAVSSGSRPA